MARRRFIEAMKRYYLFAASYSSLYGGFDHFQGDFEDERLAIGSGEVLLDGNRRLDWFHVVDIKLNKIVYNSDP